MDDYKEANQDKWRKLHEREQMLGTDELDTEEQFSEALSLIESMEERQSNGDVVNWDERAEMAAAAQRNPGLIQSDESQPTQDAPPGNLNEGDGQQQKQQNEDYQPTGTNSEQPAGNASNEQEKELMEGLAGIMNELEGFENDKQ